MRIIAVAFKLEIWKKTIVIIVRRRKSNNMIEITRIMQIIDSEK
jgi:hypothetical protein